MEQWKDIPEFEGFYQVSDLGNVKSLARVTARPRGPLPVAEKVLKPSVGNHGYLVVNLRKDGKTSQRTVHTLVAEAFIGPRPAGHDVCHADGTRTNNQLGNLRYDARIANVRDAHAHGTHVKGSKIGNSKLTEDDVQEIRRRLSADEGVMDLARSYGLSHTTIIGIREGRNWAWL